MKHHFGDMLDREGGYWTIIPNRERYAYRIGDVPVGSREITIITIGKDDEHWSRVSTLPNLEELTLHQPTNEQLEAAGRLKSVKRLRITHAQPKTLDFIRTMIAVEELVLEYVSGFSDLSPFATSRTCAGSACRPATSPRRSTRCSKRVFATSRVPAGDRTRRGPTGISKCRLSMSALACPRTSSARNTPRC
jgi:hypothetical protein